MKKSDLSLKLPPKQKDKRSKDLSQLGRDASTLPNTPFLQTSRERDEISNRLGRIKSLGKIDIRSPVITHNPSPGPDTFTHFGDDVSLYTSRTHNTMTSRLLNFVPDALYHIRHYYNDFTTIDWANAFIKTNKFQYELHHKHWISNDKHSLEDPDTKIPLLYRYYLILGRWLLIVLIGFVFSLVAYGIDKVEIMLVGLKHGYCKTNWFLSQVSCCSTDNGVTTAGVSKNVFKSGYVFQASVNEEKCRNWVSWSAYFEHFKYGKSARFDFWIYVVLTISLAVVACIITLTTEISGRYPISASQDVATDKPSLSSDRESAESPDDDEEDDSDSLSSEPQFVEGKTMYTAAGSGVPEVKTILSGFVIRRFLGTYTFFSKTIALVLAIASGMSLGKEGPYVHLATCVGNILSRFFPFVSNNEAIQKQILSAAASSGVALAFGSPLGGVLFILEEINHSLPSFQLFQIFFCAIISTLFLKFLDPYNTGNTVLFELSYSSDWSTLELVCFIFIGMAGGVFGALFVKFVAWWPKVFRQLKPIKNHPVFEVTLLALLTGIITFWNPYTKQATTELVLDLATPCSSHELDRSLCPSTGEQFTKELGSLFFALVVKIILTAITFGAKLPIGIYVPSMVIGALFGRFFGMVIEWLNYTYSLNLVSTGTYATGSIPSIMKYICSSEGGCVDLGIYAMISAGAFMAGVTRMNITLVTILFEITSSYTYVLPISIAIAVANWMGGLIEPNSLYESLLIANDYPFMSPETEPIDPFTTAGEVVEDLAKYVEKSEVPTLQSAKQAVPSTPNVAQNVFLQPRTPAHVTSIIDEDTRSKLYIDITSTPYVSLSILKQKHLILANKALLDGCVALVRKDVCVGLIFFAELEFCIDKVEEFCLQYEINEDVYCKLHEEDDYLYGDTSVEMIRAPVKHNLLVAKNAIELTPSEVDYFNYGSLNDGGPEVELVLELQHELTTLSDFTEYVNYHPIFLNYNSELSLAHLIFDKIGTRVIVLLKNGKYYGVLHKKALIDFIRREK